MIARQIEFFNKYNCFISAYIRETEWPLRPRVLEDSQELLLCRATTSLNYSWQPGCLQFMGEAFFYQTSRSVHTADSTQGSHRINIQTTDCWGQEEGKVCDLWWVLAYLGFTRLVNCNLALCIQWGEDRGKVDELLWQSTFRQTDRQREGRQGELIYVRCRGVSTLIGSGSVFAAWPYWDVDSPLQKAPGLSMFCLHTLHTRFFLKLLSVKSWLPVLASCRHTGESNQIILTMNANNKCNCFTKSWSNCVLWKGLNTYECLHDNLHFILNTWLWHVQFEQFSMCLKAFYVSFVHAEALDDHCLLCGCCQCRCELVQWHTSRSTGPTCCTFSFLH